MTSSCWRWRRRRWNWGSASRYQTAKPSWSGSKRPMRAATARRSESRSRRRMTWTRWQATTAAPKRRNLWRKSRSLRGLGKRTSAREGWTDEFRPSISETSIATWRIPLNGANGSDAVLIPPPVVFGRCGVVHDRGRRFARRPRPYGGSSRQLHAPRHATDAHRIDWIRAAREHARSCHCLRLRLCARSSRSGHDAGAPISGIVDLLVVAFAPNPG